MNIYLNSIGGKMVPSVSGETYPMHDPATGELVGSAQLSVAADMQQAVSVAKEAWARSAWRHDSALRGRCLLEAARLLIENRETLAELYTKNHGKPLSEALYELTTCADAFTYTAGAARSLFGRSIDPVPNSLSLMVRESMGVVGILTPWNWPIQLMVREMVPALAAGNAVVIKPASLTAAISMKVVELLCSIKELPPGIINAVTGPGPVLGEVICTSPDIRAVSFTGNGRTGAEVSQMAAPTFKKVLLELGGKSPNIIFDDADMEKAINVSTTAAFTTSGQLCMAGTRLLVQDSIYDEVVCCMKESIEDLTVGNGLVDGTRLGPLISEKQMNMVLEYIELGKKEGTCVTGGHRLTGPDYDKGFFVAPTMFTDLPVQSRLVQEEIFGPVLVVQKFSTEAEALALANGTVFGLAGAVWTKNINRALRLAKGIEAGTVWINDYFKLFHQTEFGGYKASGLGRTRGIDGILEFTELKHISISLD